MTACTNKARGAVVAALAGVLALGAVPAVALATGSDVSLQWVQPNEAFEKAEVKAATFKHGNKGTFKTATDGVYTTQYAEGQPVALDEVTFELFGVGSTNETATLKIDRFKGNDHYTVEYFERDEDGNPTGDAVEDPTSVGKYVAVVTALDGNYKGAKFGVPFDITAIKLNSVELANTAAAPVIYNGEVRDFEWILKDSKGNDITDDVTEGVDYTLEYVYTGDDATEKYVTDVKDAGNYVAMVKGIEGGALEGVDMLSKPFAVEKLDLSKASSLVAGADVWIENVVKVGDEEPTNLFYLWIEGTRFDSESSVVKELKAELDPPTQVWHDNATYTYKLSAVDPNNPNIVKSAEFDAHKVANEVTFNYGDAALPESHTIVLNDLTATNFDFDKVTGFYKDGTKGGKTISPVSCAIIDSNGAKVDADTLTVTPGDYTVVFWAVDTAGHVYGGQDSMKIKVVQDKVDADASAVVTYDSDKDGSDYGIVSSISSVYDGKDLMDNIKVYVRDSNGKYVAPKASDGSANYEVKYYDSEDREVKKLVNAGTYTLKLTSSKYELSGTTEMTITISPMDLSTVKAGAVRTHKWDNVGNVTEYLPWRKLTGYTVGDLKLEYKDADGDWQPLSPAYDNDVKVTMYKGAEEITRIDDEGVYTVKFEARNADAANNYVIPGDLTVTCIKNGHNKDGVDHLKFRDVEYSDYFVNAVDYVSGKQLMTGYKFTKLFGADDTMNRGQMAIVLYNMAKGDGMMDENSLKYDETEGYITGYEDVDGNEYYAKAIAWARLAGVVNGYDETHFGPEDPVTREQFAAMIMNYEKKFGDYEQADASVLDDFSDAGSVSAWATNAMSWAVANGVVNGTAEGTLIPTCDIIRADAACMVYNYVK